MTSSWRNIVIFGLTVDGSPLALAALMVMTVVTAVSFGFCGLAICGSQAAFDAWTYGGALLMAAIGGAITPVELLPSWADTLSPTSPIHWSVEGASRVILDGGGFGAIAGQAGLGDGHHAVVGLAVREVVDEAAQAQRFGAGDDAEFPPCIPAPRRRLQQSFRGVAQHPVAERQAVELRRRAAAERGRAEEQHAARRPLRLVRHRTTSSKCARFFFSGLGRRL